MCGAWSTTPLWRADTRAEESWPGGAGSAAQAFQELLAAGLDNDDARALWAEAAEKGQLQALLDAMEEHMSGLPETTGKHEERARAYYAAARAMPGNTDGNWWVESDNAFSRALELDPNHWEARYAKARNLSFWPSAYGGQAEAIRHFETLAGQQQGRTDEPRFAKTYMWLGNLYDQQGRTAEARQTWEQGLALFPQDETLLKKLASLGQ